MELVDKENDVAFGGGNFLQDGLEALFEFATKFGAGNQCAQVQYQQAFFFETLGHIPVDDTMGEAFGDCGFTNAGLTDEDGIVFSST